MAATYKFEAIPDIFQQSLAETDPVTFRYAQCNMGLITQPSTESDDKPWVRFMQFMEHLQSVAPPGVHYKLIIAARHGEGFHNVVEVKYGVKAWDETWSKLDELEGARLLDARLTPVGEQQARDAGTFLQQQIEQGLPVPQTYYVSPLIRCLQTAHLTWSDRGRPFRPVVKEMAREVLGVHTCDKRSSRTVILENFPDITIEDGFTEEDELWQKDHRETHDENDVRCRALLDDIFNTDPSSVISLTSHSGACNCLLRVLGNRRFRLQTGALIPLLVKATKQ